MLHSLSVILCSSHSLFSDKILPSIAEDICCNLLKSSSTLSPSEWARLASRSLTLATSTSVQILFTVKRTMSTPSFTVVTRSVMVSPP